MAGLTSTGFVAATTSDVQTAIQNDELGLIDPALNLSPVQPLGQLNGIFASAAANVWALLAAIYAAIDPAGAVGVQLDNLSAITGCTRLAATKTLALCSLTLAAGTYNAGTLTANIFGNPQLTFVNRDTIVSTGGATQAYFVATVTGPIACNATTLIVISSPVSGWTGIINAQAGATGTNTETDAALRPRRATLLATVGGGTLDSLRSSLLTLVPGILQVSFVENNTNDTSTWTMQSNGTYAWAPARQPPHSIEVFIWDVLADDAKIAQVIWNSKPAGVSTFGNSSAVAFDSKGGSQIVYFTRVVQVPITFAISVTTSAAFAGGGVGIAQVQAAMVAAGASQAMGAKVIALSYIAAALSVPGVLDVGPGGSPFLMNTPTGIPSAANISLQFKEIATVAAANIAVTVWP